MPGTIRESFFRPQELARERLTIPAALYNLCRLALGRCGQDCVFVPVRTMLVQAVIDSGEVIFVDSQDYAVRNGRGGKLVCLAWAFRHGVGRGGLSEPAPIELIYYRADSRQLHSRLIGEFRQALEQFTARFDGAGGEQPAGRVLPFRR